MDAVEDALAVIRVRSWLRDGTARAVRTRAGLSQAAVERAVGASAGQVARWESGRNAPGYASAVRLARLYGELEKITAEKEGAPADG